MASTYLTRTPSSTGNRKKWTWSAWLKRTALNSSGSHYIFSANNASNQYSMLAFASDELRWYDYTSSFHSQLKTNRLFRDTNAWYHIVITYDTGQSTASNRIKFYVNGVQETSLKTSDYPSQDYDGYINLSALPHYIGRETGSSNLFEGIMSHVHFTDGYAYDASAFGSTDSTTGEWKINTSPSVSYGTNGYFIFKDGMTITDQSPNSNNWTVSAGTLTKTEDCPSNNFATLNPLVLIGSVSFTAGNTKFSKTTGSYWRSGFSTLGMTTGKYYFEVLSNQGTDNFVGARDVETCDGSLAGNNDHLANVTAGYGLYSADGKVKGNSNSDLTGVIGTFTDGDYIGCFLDLDNNKLYFSKNGTMLNTTGVDIASDKTYLFGVSGYNSGSRLSCNFGNGAFDNNQLTGTTYNGSDGNGIFKYDPNNITLDGSSKSFKSLSTKGLNE